MHLHKAQDQKWSISQAQETLKSQSVKIRFFTIKTTAAAILRLTEAVLYQIPTLVDCFHISPVSIFTSCLYVSMLYVFLRYICWCCMYSLRFVIPCMYIVCHFKLCDICYSMCLFKIRNMLIIDYEIDMYLFVWFYCL